MRNGEGDSQGLFRFVHFRFSDHPLPRSNDLSRSRSTLFQSLDSRRLASVHPESPAVPCVPHLARKAYALEHLFPEITERAAPQFPEIPARPGILRLLKERMTARLVSIKHDGRFQGENVQPTFPVCVQRMIVSVERFWDNFSEGGSPLFSKRRNPALPSPKTS